MSEKIGLARAEIVDLLSLILRTHSRDELFSLFRSAEGITPKEDPEAWREDCRKRQAAGVKFQRKSCGEWVHPINMFDFSGNKEDYREVAEEPRPEIPHIKERILWLAQREAGTNEIWQVTDPKIDCTLPIPVDMEPGWEHGYIYRVKPMKLTAKICRKEILYKTVQDWEFTGTREEYRAECEKYGYVVISEIKEVKPETVKYYFALCKTPDGYIGAKFHEDKQRLTDWIITCCGTIIGDIEEREIEA